MDIISYNKEEIDSKLQTWHLKQGFDKNPTLTRYIKKLSDQYKKYKLSYKFPTKYKGNKGRSRSKTKSPDPPKCEISHWGGSGQNGVFFTLFYFFSFMS